MKILINYLQLKKEKLKSGKKICFNMLKNHYSVVECIYMQ